MDKVDRGKKYTCSNCMTKFYDFNKDIAICPKCGTEQKSKKIVTNDLKNNKNTINEREVIEENNLEEEVDFDNIDKMNIKVNYWNSTSILSAD